MSIFNSIRRTSNDPTPPKEDIKQETKIETKVVKENETKNRDDAPRSIFNPIKFVRFPSMLGDEKREKGSLFKEENVIKVSAKRMDKKMILWPTKLASIENLNFVPSLQKIIQLFESFTM